MACVFASKLIVSRARGVRRARHARSLCAALRRCRVPGVGAEGERRGGFLAPSISRSDAAVRYRSTPSLSQKALALASPACSASEGGRR